MPTLNCFSNILAALGWQIIEAFKTESYPNKVLKI
jgi:hypothetical protein